MKSRKPGSPKKSGRLRNRVLRALGYGGTAALVVAAIVVLIMPLVKKDDGSGAAGAGPTAGGGGGQTTGRSTTPGNGGGSPFPSNPAPQQNNSGRPYPGQSSGSGSGQGGNGGDQGPPLPGSGGGTGVGMCPVGTAVYHDVGGALEVMIKVAGSGLVKAEASLRGRPSVTRQSSVKGGAPVTLTFNGVPTALVERVKVTTFSVGAAMDNCYATPG
ncbi:hypothetical protein J4573_37035 [Actinomadura barringtoniae]|uniref:Uncharacterized protein n=1 Tax=Actinomadura barringtoniae TaxID=1427535 RepID=A0A939PQA2_9ACTN|nr:hypothetical protein [Actinomadura barringtoniae]MBO2452746.1 hypothetical protein [Actinomadura barringtoniae]